MAHSVEFIREALQKQGLILTIEKTPKWIFTVKDMNGNLIARVKNKQSLYRHIR